jgi:uncharacterized protein
MTSAPWPEAALLPTGGATPVQGVTPTDIAQMSRKQPKRTPRPGLDAYGRTPLHYAAAAGNADLMQSLLQGAVDVDASDDNGWTALHFAAQASSVSVLKLLLDAGALVDPRDSDGNTPLSTAVFNCRGDGSVIQLLRNAGADCHAYNDHGVSPVVLARMIANFDVARYFSDVPGHTR